MRAPGSDSIPTRSPSSARTAPSALSKENPSNKWQKISLIQSYIGRMRKNIFFILLLSTLAPGMHAQELQASVAVNAQRVPPTVDHKQFQTLQAALTNFINNRKWSNESFQNNEKILC